MSVKKSVFGSKSEERGFRSIEHTWGEHYAIYPQFPWSGLFNPDPNWKDTSNLFFKTSVDYVFCEKGGRPLLAIDFDGMGRGFDRNGEYVQTEATSDPYRKAKFDYKLQCARNNGFPYYIVSSEEFARLGDDVQLTVVDGIIGSTLARQAFHKRVESYVEEYFDALYDAMESDPSTPEHLKPVRQKIQFSKNHQSIGTMAGLEVECDAEFNPFFKMEAQVREEIVQLIYGQPGYRGYRTKIHRFQEPEFPDFDFGGFFRGDNVVGSGTLDATLDRMLQAFEKVELRGCVVTLEDTPVGEVSEVVTIRNVAHSETLVQEIAESMVYCKLLRLLRREQEVLDNLPL